MLDKLMRKRPSKYFLKIKIFKLEATISIGSVSSYIIGKLAKWKDTFLFVYVTVLALN